MKAYTKKGDWGCTRDLAGKILSKDSPIIEGWGKIDELQSIIDLAMLRTKGRTKTMLYTIQKKLWQTSAEIAHCPKECLTEPITILDLHELERFIDAQGEPPTKFIRFTTYNSIIFNECRVRCRSAERALVPLLRKKTLRPVVYQYFNRLSSLFFMLGYGEERRKRRKYNLITK